MISGYRSPHFTSLPQPADSCIQKLQCEQNLRCRYNFLAQWRFGDLEMFLFDSPFSHCPCAPTILFSCPPPPPPTHTHTPLPPVKLETTGRGEQGVLTAM